MARTHKIQKLHEHFATGAVNSPFYKGKAGYRYGNNRKTWAKLKVTQRKIERRKNNKLEV